MSEKEQIATVEWRMGTYTGTEKVTCDHNDDNEWIVARAKHQVHRRNGPTGMAMYSESWKVTDRRYA